LTWLDRADFKRVVANAPLVSIDLLVRDVQGRLLVGLRNNEPAQGTWFVPGGRVLKDETLAQAFARLCRDELGLQVEIAAADFRGVFEHFYDVDFTGDRGATTHYIVLAYAFDLPAAAGELPKAQHREYRWIDTATAHADAAVHANTRAYFVD
jgi:colanic acid biosynthesis protein WcaH